MSGADMNKLSRKAWNMLCCYLPSAYASPEFQIGLMVGSIQECDRRMILMQDTGFQNNKCGTWGARLLLPDQLPGADE